MKFEDIVYTKKLPLLVGVPLYTLKIPTGQKISGE